MTPSRGCPSDRSELVSVLEDRASEALRGHVDGCERCRVEVQELRGTLELLSTAAEGPPSERVRREAVSYARSQVRGPVTRWTPWRAPVAAMIGVVFAVFFGELADARLTSSAPQIRSPELWTLVLAAVWSIALFLYATPGASMPRKEIVGRSLAGASAFAVLLLALPIPVAMELCAAWAFGPGQLTSGVALGAYAVIASVYAVVPAACVSRVWDGDLSRSEERVVALTFAVLAGPLLLHQAAAHPAIAGVAGIGGLVCGAWMGGRLGSRRR